MEILGLVPSRQARGRSVQLQHGTSPGSLALIDLPILYAVLHILLVMLSMYLVLYTCETLHWTKIKERICGCCLRVWKCWTSCRCPILAFRDLRQSFGGWCKIMASPRDLVSWLFSWNSFFWILDLRLISLVPWSESAVLLDINATPHSIDLSSLFDTFASHTQIQATETFSSIDSSLMENTMNDSLFGFMDNNYHSEVFSWN